MNSTNSNLRFSYFRGYLMILNNLGVSDPCSTGRPIKIDETRKERGSHGTFYMHNIYFSFNES